MQLSTFSQLYHKELLQKAQDSLHQHYSHNFKVVAQKLHIKNPNSNPGKDLKKGGAGVEIPPHPPFVSEEKKLQPPRSTHTQLMTLSQLGLIRGFSWGDESHHG